MKEKNILERRKKFFYDVCRMIIYLKTRGYEFAPTEYFRDFSRQQELVKEKKSQILQSKHVLGLAIDLVYVVDGEPVWQRCRAYEEAGKYWKEAGHTWGGDWKSLNDIYHFEE
jgi:hypothetical protein